MIKPISKCLDFTRLRRDAKAFLLEIFCIDTGIIHRTHLLALRTSLVWDRYIAILAILCTRPACLLALFLGYLIVYTPLLLASELERVFAGSVTRSTRPLASFV